MNEAALPPCCAEWLRLSDGDAFFLSRLRLDSSSKAQPSTIRGQSSERQSHSAQQSGGAAKTRLIHE